MTGVQTCALPICGRSYHVTNRPARTEGRCDACGTALVTRTDDAPETVAARLENQLDSLQAVVALYRDSGRLGVVSGSGSIAEIGERLATAATALGFTPR